MIIEEEWLCWEETIKFICIYISKYIKLATILCYILGKKITFFE